MHWWAEMEECSGASRPFGAVEWYFVPADDLARLQGGAIGLTWPTRDRIYLPPGNMYAKGVVQHEMLHALGFRGHPIPPFGSCAPAWGWLP